MTNSKKFALISTVTLVAVLILCALAVFFIPAVGKIVSGGCSAVKTESPQAVALFVNLKAQRSPLAITALALLPALIPGMPLRGLLESAQSMFGPVAGTIFVWAGLFIGLLLGGALGYLLVGQHLKRKRASKDVQTTSPSKAHMLVYYGSRIFPYFPQGIVAFVSGAFVPRCRGALAGAFLASSMIIVNALAPQPFVFYGFAALGCALMGVALYLKRDSLATNNVLTPERKKTLAIASAVIVACAAVYLAVPGVKDSIQNAVRVTMGNPAGVAAYLRGFGIIGPIVSFSLMVLQSVAAPLPAFVITFANGMIWGWALGALLSWSSAMAGAALCFWLARWFGRPLVEKLAGGSSALEISDKFFEKFGNKAVLIARLLPFVSFDIISYGAGLTSMGFWEFFWATGLGQLPATLVYSYLASVGGAATSIKILLYVFIATAVLLVLGIALKPWFMRTFFGEATQNSDED